MSAVIDRILNNVEIIPPCLCWHWVGAVANRSKGSMQPVFKHQGKPQPVRRVIFETMFGEIPEKVRVIANCGSIDCVRPEHLKLVHGSSFLNSCREKQKEFWLRRTHFKCGHEKSPENIDRHLERGIRRERCKTCREKYKKLWTARRGEMRAIAREQKGLKKWGGVAHGIYNF